MSAGHLRCSAAAVSSAEQLLNVPLAALQPFCSAASPEKSLTNCTVSLLGHRSRYSHARAKTAVPTQS